MKNDEVIGAFLYGLDAENKTLNSTKVSKDKANGETAMLRSYNTLIGIRTYDPSTKVELVTLMRPKYTSTTTSRHINLLKEWADRWVLANLNMKREVISQDV